MEHFVITNNVYLATLILYVVIITIIVGLKLSQVIFKKDVDNLYIRMKSFLFIVLFFTASFWFNRLTAICFLALISYLSLKEFISLLPIRHSDRNVMLWAYLSIPVQFYIIYIHWTTMFYLFVPLYMFILISIRMVMTNNTNGFLKNLAVLQYGLMVTVYAIGYLGMIINIPNEINPIGGSIGLLFYILILTITNDFTQMISGKTFGKHKIIPKISPNKTWEGFIGGVIGTSILSILMGLFLTPLNAMQLAFLGCVLAISGFFGDVTMSAIKRDLGIKDTSTLIPGHGGILDRLDSLIFTAPLFYHFVAYIYHIPIVR